MKIIFLHITQNYSGVEKRFFHYYQYLSTLSDNEYTFVCSKTFLKRHNLSLSAFNKHKIIEYGIEWRNVSKIRRYIDYLCLLLVLLKLSVKKYDAAHFPTTGSRIFMRLIRAKSKSTSVVNSIKSCLDKEISSPIFIKCLKAGVLVDCLDRNICSFIASKYPSYSKQLFVSPCSFVSYKGCCDKLLNKEHAIAFVGRLIEYKGIDMLISQLQNILNKTTFKIYILGRGPYASKIDDFKRKYDNNNRIYFDFVLNPIRILEKAQVFLSLQSEENYPSQSLLEAMMAQNTIIATNVGLTSTLVKTQFGFLINDGSELLDRLVFLEEHPEIIMEMGKKAKEFAESNHRVEIYHNYLISLYSPK